MQPVYRWGTHISTLARALKLLLANKEYWRGKTTLIWASREKQSCAPKCKACRRLKGG